MVTAIVNTLTSWVTAFVDLVVLVMTSLTDIFWDAAASEGAGALTLPGTLALMATAIGLIYLGLRFILQLFPGAHQL